MKRFLMPLGLAIGLALVTARTVLAFQGGDPGTDPVVEGEIAAKLAALVAAATAVERIIEMVFDLYESTVLNARAFIGNGKSYVSWMKQQVNAVQHALVTLKDPGKGPDPDAAQKRLELENALADAEQRLTDHLNSSSYKAAKRAISLIAGIVLGVALAFATQLRMLVMLDVLPATTAGAVAFFDILLTGLVVGTGSAPVHSLIGILQKTKDTLDETRAKLRSDAMNIRQLTGDTFQAESTGGAKKGKAKTLPVDEQRMKRRMLRS